MSASSSANSLEETVRRAKDGSSEAVVVLIEGLFERESQWIRSIARNPAFPGIHEVEDARGVMADAVMQGLSGLEWSTEPELWAWLSRVGRRACLEVKRFHEREKRAERKTVQLDLDSVEASASGVLRAHRTPSKSVRRREFRLALTVCLACLRPFDRKVATMSDHGYAAPDIAKTLDVEISDVENSKKRTVAFLRRRLKEHFDVGGGTSLFD